MLIQAVIANFGIALVPDFLCEELIQKGELINPLNITLASDNGYYLLSPSYKKDALKVIKFNDWITEYLI